MEKIQIDREKSEQLFYEIRDLGIFLAQNLSGVVQNPDFAVIRDFEGFKEDCARFEEKYEIIKKEVEKLFLSSTPQ